MWQRRNALKLVFRMLPVPKAVLIGLASPIAASGCCSVCLSSALFLTLFKVKHGYRDILGVVIILQESCFKAVLKLHRGGVSTSVKEYNHMNFLLLREP